MPSHSSGKRKTVIASVAGIIVMIGLVVGAVPLYRLFCQATGYGGTTRVSAASPYILDQTVTVRFDANVAKDLPWRFAPQQREVTVKLGDNALAFYTVTNISEHTTTGTATFNVTPQKVGRYFAKIDCFCFTEQTLRPGESAQLPVSFFVDPALIEDQYSDEVKTITLSYTFFRADQGGRS